jgi:hypothetical protein
MSAPFGPQLIGETEKTLREILLRILEKPALTEPQWVAMRIADMLDGSVDSDGLVTTVTNRAHFRDAGDLVRALTDRGLLEAGHVTASGHELISDVQAAISRATAPIWDGLPPEDVAAATRVLNEVLTRARVALG